MAYSYTDRQATTFRFGESFFGTFQGMIIEGTGFTYAEDGTPTGGTVTAIRFESEFPFYQGSFNGLGRITFPVGTLITSLLDPDIGLFVSRPVISGGPNLHIDGLLDTFDQLDLVGLLGVATPTLISGGRMNDTISLPSNTTYVGTIKGGGGDDRITVSGQTLTVDGGWGGDRIEVTATDSTITGGEGGDKIFAVGKTTVSGEIGRDHIHLYAGASSSTAVQSTAHGGEGNDKIWSSGFNKDTIYGDEGNDKLILVETVSLSAKGIAYGGTGNDKIMSEGGIGLSIMFGEAGDDTLTGGYGNDRMFGGEGDDVLRGNGGTDYYYLSEGKDKAYGGDGRDQFALDLAAGETLAKVFDFAIAEDVIIFDGTGTWTATQARDEFFAHATQDGDNIVYDNGAGDVLILEDVLLIELTLANFSAEIYPGDPTL